MEEPEEVGDTQRKSSPESSALVCVSSLGGGRVGWHQ